MRYRLIQTILAHGTIAVCDGSASKTAPWGLVPRIVTSAWTLPRSCSEVGWLTVLRQADDGADQ